MHASPSSPSKSNVSLMFVGSPEMLADIIIVSSSSYDAIRAWISPCCLLERVIVRGLPVLLLFPILLFPILLFPILLFPCLLSFSIIPYIAAFYIIPSSRPAYVTQQ